MPGVSNFIDRWSGPLALLCAVLAARLFLISNFGSPLPYWDEWDAGAQGLYGRYYAGKLELRSLFGPHNEHRFLTSRLLNLLTFEVAGAWNPRFQMMINAALFAGIVAWFAALLSRLLDPAYRLALYFGTAAIFALPIDHQISLMGMNAHFYMLVLFSLLALHLMSGAVTLSIRWWLGMLCCVLAYFSMASGAATPLVGIVLVVLQMAVRARPVAWREAIGIAILAVSAAAMLYFVPDLPHHEPLKAHSIGEFLMALWRAASYPLPAPFGLLVVQAPLFLLAAWVLIKRPARGSIEWTALAVAGWVAASMMSLAYSRAPGPVDSRYLDFMLIALPISMTVLLRAVSMTDWARLLLVGWVTAVMIGLLGQGMRQVEQIDKYYEMLAKESLLVTRFLVEGDPAVLATVKAIYPRPEVITNTLSLPQVRAIIPSAIQPQMLRGPLDPPPRLLRGGLFEQVEWLVSVLPYIANVVAGLAVVLAVFTLAGPVARRREEKAAAADFSAGGRGDARGNSD